MGLTLQELRKRGPRVGTFVRKFYDKEPTLLLLMDLRKKYLR